MELILTRQFGSRIAVICNGDLSHTFDLSMLPLTGTDHLPQFRNNPVAYGQAIYHALFLPETLAQRTLESTFERILLVTTDNDLDAVAWEYAYGPSDFIVLDHPFARGLSADQRIDPPIVDSGLHIVGIPSNPLDKQVPPLNIEGEWERLKEIIQEVPFAVTLERTRPPTLEQVRRLVANQQNRCMHFMGHGGQHETGAILYFEQHNGGLDPVTARDFIHCVRDSAFLVTLNACVSAAPEQTTLANLAWALVQQKIPYTVGMRFSIIDEDARTFSRVFYSDLARGTSVEEAMLQARLALAKSPHPWAIGVPVLYTALKKPANGFTSIKGQPSIDEHQPRVEGSALTRAEGAFQGHVDELREIGDLLTGDSRPRLVTIHGGGGQGKTALACEVVERFAYAWPGGVWATTLETLPSREMFVNDLANFLGIATQETADFSKLERQVVDRLKQCRTLIVLDNAETLLEAIEANNEAAVRLAQFIREQLPRPPVSLLATSRSFLGWESEIGYELEGLAPPEGARLFWQNAPRRADEINQKRGLARELSQKVEGHPLSLRLLGSAFNASALSFPAFIKDYEAQLLEAENKYKQADHRQRTLYACMEISIRYLDAELQALLSGLWVFHAPFLPETADAIFSLGARDPEMQHPPVSDQLNVLWQHGLLTREIATIRDGRVLLYHLLPVVRTYVEKYLKQAYKREELLKWFGLACELQVNLIFSEMNRSATQIYLARRAREDFERGAAYVGDSERGYYLLHLGSILQRLGDNQKALELDKEALEIARSQQERQMEGQALANIGTVYNAIGQTQQALKSLEQALQALREIGDRAGEASTLNNMALVYWTIGQPQQALERYEQALSMRQVVGDRQGEATILNNIATIYQGIGQPQKALKLYEQALPIRREVGDRAGEASTLTNIGWTFQQTGQIEKALEQYEQALPIWQEIGDRSGEASALNNMALLYQETGRPQQALELYEQVLLINQEIDDQRGKATTLNNKALVYRDIGQFQQALELYEEALFMRQEVGDRQGEAETLNNIATIYQETGQLQQALEFLELALPIAQEVGHRADEGSFLTNMAEIYLETDRPQRALELSKQALSIRSEVGDKWGEAATLNKMARAYQGVEQPQRALELFEQALLIEREVGDQQGEAETLTNMALLYDETGQPQQALELLEQALPIRRKVRGQPREAATLTSMAMTYQKMGQLQRALELYGQVLPILRETGDRASEALALVKMAEAYQKARQPQWALELYEQALPILREVSNRKDEAATLNNMATAYRETGQPTRALELLEQTLPLCRERGDRVGEAAALNNMAMLYYDTGQPQRALDFMGQALPLSREIGNRVAEDSLLTSMAKIYQDLRQPQQALELYEQALPIEQELGNRRDEARLLTSMAKMYRYMMQPRRALELYEQVLPIVREVGERQGEAATLNEMALMYERLGQRQRALELYEQALPIEQEVGDRKGASATLNNIACMYLDKGQLQHARDLLEQALALDRQGGGRASEATTLTNMADVYADMGHPQQAVELDKQALKIEQEMGDQTHEATTRVNMAIILYQSLNRAQEAIRHIEQAIDLLTELGLLEDEAGRSMNTLQQVLHSMRQGAPLDKEADDYDALIATHIPMIIVNTIAVMTEGQEYRAEWREHIVQLLQQVQSHHRQHVAEFFTAILSTLDGQPFTLSKGHPYAKALAEIQEGIAT